MSKKFNILVHTGKTQSPRTIELTQGEGDRGHPVRIKAQAGAKYQVQDLEKNLQVGPQFVKVKRSGKNLHLVLEGSTEPDLIIEDYYEVMDAGDTGLVGRAENGSLYEYLPEDPHPQGLTQTLVDGQPAVNMALGGSEYEIAGAAVAAIALGPWFASAAGAAALLAGGGKSKGVSDTTAPAAPTADVAAASDSR